MIAWRGVPNGKALAWKAGERKLLQVRVLSPPHRRKLIVERKLKKDQVEIDPQTIGIIE